MQHGARQPRRREEVELIVSLSLMQRRKDISDDEFRAHWLDPHGVMTAELPNTRRYVQGHVIDSPATNDLARRLGLLGFAVLSYDSVEDRQAAYTSPRIRECDKDSEEFVGAVSRVVTANTRSAAAGSSAAVCSSSSSRSGSDWIAMSTASA